MPPTLHTLVAQAELDFKKNYCDGHAGGNTDGGNYPTEPEWYVNAEPGEVLTFLRTHLQLVAQEMRRAIRERVPTDAREQNGVMLDVHMPYNDGFAAARSQALEVIEKFINGKE